MIKSKIEKKELAIIDINNKQMKVITTIDSTLLCGVLDFSGRKYYVDIEGFNKFSVFDKRFSFINTDDKYPSYLHNYKRFSLLEFLFNFNSSNITYVFKNNNEYDLRKTNVDIYHNYHEIVKGKYKIIEYIQGHYIELGIDSYVMKNPLWKVLNENNEEELLMYCEKDTLTKICDKSYKCLLDYELKHQGKKLTFYIHQIITGCYGNDKGTKEISVDHKDQNPLNNSFDNLHIATRQEQEKNTKGIMECTKRARNHNAKILPEGITSDMFLKYVIYYHEWLNKDETKFREYFKIEKHPKLDKIWIGTKSNKVPILEKLRVANKVVEDLKNNIYPANIKENDVLPKYITIKVERGKPHLIFDKKDNDGNRLNLRMVLQPDYVLEKYLEVFIKKIKEKYDLII